MHKPSKFIITVLVFGYAFLYIPILTIIAYSFNESRLVTVWSGFSTKWYTALLQNDTILHAAWVSFRVATMTATLAVLLGTLAAISVVRFKKIRKTATFSGLIT